DTFAIDVSFFDFQLRAHDTYNNYGYAESSGSMGGSLVKIQGLHFFNGISNHTAYVGGGVGWGWSDFGTGTKTWTGNGLQGQLTVGYELARATTLRLFTQLDASL